MTPRNGKTSRNNLRLILVTGLIGLVFSFALVTGSSYLYLVFYSLLGFTLYPSWKIRRGFKDIKARVETDTPIVFQGESLILRWTLEAFHGPLPPVVHIEMSGSAGLSLGSQGQSLVPDLGLNQGSLEVQGVSIGLYRLDSLRIIAYDPLGLIRFEKSFGSDQIIRVYPPLIKGHLLTIKAKDQDNPTQGLSLIKTHQGESLGLRSWRPGDGVKSIHWKQSLHHDTLMVQDTGAQGLSEVVLILNCHDRDYQSSSHSNQDFSTQDLVDWVKAYCFSLIYRTLEAGIPMSLLSQEIQPGLKAENHQEVRDLLDQLLVQPGISQQPFGHYLESLTNPWINRPADQLNNQTAHQILKLQSAQLTPFPGDHAIVFVVTPTLHGAMEDHLGSMIQNNSQRVVVVPDIPHEVTTRISHWLETLGGQVVREPLAPYAKTQLVNHPKDHSYVHPMIHPNNHEEDSNQ